MDEYDLIPKEAIPVAERRLSGPRSRGLIRRIGWPSIDGYGMAKRYEESDRRRWFVKCRACKKQQFLRFFERQAREGDEGGDGLPNMTSAHVDVMRAVIVCGKCGKTITGQMVAAGQWVAEFPDREARGYHVHRLLVPARELEAADPGEHEHRPVGDPVVLQPRPRGAVQPEGRSTVPSGDCGVAVGGWRVPPGAGGHGLLR